MRSRFIAPVRRVALLLGLMVPAVSGCFVKKYVYQPVLVANAMGDSTTTLGSAKLHVYATDQFVVYGPTGASVRAAVPQLSRAYREFSKHFGVEAPPVAAVLSDTSFALTPALAGSFARRGVRTFVYVRPRKLRDIDGVPADAREDEIWPVASRAAREMLAAWVAARRHQTQEVEIVSHGEELHTDPFPTWFVDAVDVLLSDPGAPDRVMDWLRDNLDEIPLSEVLRERSAGSMLDTAAAARLHRAKVGSFGVGLVLFAIEREGPQVVARFADSFLAGGNALDVVKQLPHFPRDEHELARVWRAWVRDEYGR